MLALFGGESENRVIVMAILIRPKEEYDADNRSDQLNENNDEYQGDE